MKRIVNNMAVFAAVLGYFGMSGQPIQAQKESSYANDEIKKLILPGETFRLNGRPAFVLMPPEDKRQSPQPWIMYSPTLPGIPDKAETWMHQQFLNAGVAVAGIDIGEAYGSPAGQALFSNFYRELTENRGFAEKVCLLGRSRGGLWSSAWAISHSDKVAGIAGIYPVFDLRSYPGLKRAAPSYGLSVNDLEANLDKHNPISQAAELAKAKIPVFIIHGDSDKVVPIEQNSLALKSVYEAAGASSLITVDVAPGQGHNMFEGFFRCQKLVEFAIRQAKSSAQSPERNATERKAK